MSHIARSAAFINSLGAAKPPRVASTSFVQWRRARAQAPTPSWTAAPIRNAPRTICCNPSTHGSQPSSVTEASAAVAREQQAPVASECKFVAVRTVIFGTMALTYAAYVLLRATFTYSAPAMAASLRLSLHSIGEITSAFPLAYGLSRLLTGVVVDRAAPHVALAGGLFLAGLANVAMGCAGSVAALAALWGLNGLVQGVGAGSAAKMLLNWFGPSERGFFWALWSTSANVGGFVAPIVCGRLAGSGLGFRSGMIVPGAVAMGLAAVAVVVMRSSPQQMGFGARAWEGGQGGQGGQEEEKEGWKEAMTKGVLKNGLLWTLAIGYFFIYFVRAGMKSWLHFWLVEAHGVSAAEAAYRVSGVEVGGIAGTFSAGMVSDWAGGRRVAVTIVYLLGLMGSVAAMWMRAGVGGAVWDFVWMGVVGFMVNGPQMMVGLIGAEVVDKRVVGTANGMLGLVSYVGAAASGMPLAVVIERWRWRGFFWALLACSLLSVSCLSRLWGLKAVGAER